MTCHNPKTPLISLPCSTVKILYPGEVVPVVKYLCGKCEDLGFPELTLKRHGKVAPACSLSAVDVETGVSLGLSGQLI